MKAGDVDYIVCSIQESKDITILTIDELQSSLLVHEQRMGSHVEEEDALKITHGEQSGGRSQGRGSFRGRGRGRGRQTFNKAIVEKDQSKEKEANYEEMLVMAYVNMNKANKDDMWFLDSGLAIPSVERRIFFRF